MKSLTVRIFDALILSIPLLIMGLLAAVTFWLVVITPEISHIAKTKLLRDAPDLTVNNFIVERFDHNGTLRSNLKADMAYRIPVTNEIIVDRVDMMTTESMDNSSGAQPVLGTPGIDFFRVTAIADRSILHNAESMIELLDSAYVTRQPFGLSGDNEKIEFLGDELKILLEEGKLISDKPVDISQDGTRFTADTMTYDYATNTLQMRGKVIGDSVRPLR